MLYLLRRKGAKVMSRVITAIASNVPTLPALETKYSSS
jgi:hypothetical protein